MSPEQVRGINVDHRSDIFSLGAILYEMSSGQRAFQGPTPADTMTAILKEDPPELTGTSKKLPPALGRIVQRCLEKDAAERFQSARDLAFNLELLSGETTTIALMRKLRHRGVCTVDWIFTFACAVYNLVRMRNLNPVVPTG
jgi:serine/threonine protein kinase